MIFLKKINSNNIWDVINLTVQEQQKNFVATNTKSILEAYVTITEGNGENVALPFAVYDDDTLIGFVMIGYGTTGDVDEPKVARKNYTVWRLMIDKKYQGKGLGRATLLASIKYIRTWPCGGAKYCWIAYEPNNHVAKSLYSSIGFLENGEKDGADIVAVLKL